MNLIVSGIVMVWVGFWFYDNIYYIIVYQDWFSWCDNFIESVVDIFFNGKLIQYNGVMLNISYNIGCEFVVMIVLFYFWENWDIYKKGKLLFILEGYCLVLICGWEQVYQDFVQVYDFFIKLKIRVCVVFNVVLVQEVFGNL